MKLPFDRVQAFMGIIFSITTLAAGGSQVSSPSDLSLFFTPSVEPFEMESAAATPVPAVSGKDWEAAQRDLDTGQILSSTDDLPYLTARMGEDEFGAASLSGQDDLLVIWITRDGERLYQVVSIDNPSLYGPRDPVTESPLGLGYLERMEDWEVLREKRQELMAGWFTVASSSAGIGSSAAGSIGGSRVPGFVGMLAGLLDVVTTGVERYINAGRTYFAMRAVEQDLENLFDEARMYELQGSEGS